MGLWVDNGLYLEFLGKNRVIARNPEHREIIVFRMHSSKSAWESGEGKEGMEEGE